MMTATSKKASFPWKLEPSASGFLPFEVDVALVRQTSRLLFLVAL
jgi:hypothetical protein